MGRKSKIEGLPDLVQGQLKKALQKNRKTLDDLVQWLKDEFDVEVTRSSLHRYKVNFETVLEEQRRVSEITERMIAQMGEAPEGDSGRVLVEMVKALSTRSLAAALSDPDREIAEKEIAFLCKAMKDLTTAQRTSFDIEKRIRTEIAAKLDAAEGEARAAGEKGLSSERLAQLRREFLGVRDEK